MKLTVLITGAILFCLPAAALAQTPSPAPASTASATPAETATLTVPAGYTEKPASMSMGGFIMDHMWMTDAAPGDNINIGHSPIPASAAGKSGSVDAIAAQMRAGLDKVFGPTAVTVWHSEKVCGGTQPGWFSQMNLTFGAMHIITEQTMTFGKSAVYAATYTRKQSDPEDAAARGALDTLCVKS